MRDAIVIGGGIAGMSAAWRLRHSDVLVLEGSNRIGGRLRSEKLARLVETNRIHPEKLITHRFTGLEHVEEALMLMKNKPADLIKPLVVIE